MVRPAVSIAAALCAALLAVAAPAQEVPTFTTDDVERDPKSVTTENRAIAEREAEEARTVEVAAAATTPGYTRVAAARGYSFERPSGWTVVETLEAKGAPTSFTVDAVFQDPQTGSVVTAISLDRAQAGATVDIADEGSVNSLLATMLNPTGAQTGVKIFRRLNGENPDGSRWLRIKAEGTGQSADGQIVPTHFWVQMVQTPTVLALVAVGYPPAQQETAALHAFHTVRTLEIGNAPGTPGPAPDVPADAGEKPRKKNSAGGMRKQQ